MTGRLFDDEPPPPDSADAPAVSGAHAPLAARLRPRNLDEVVGQRHLVGPEGPLRVAVETGRLHSLILWGPPGTGKTTLADVLGHSGDAASVTLSAVSAGVRDVRAVIEAARTRLASRGQTTVLFLDEIHRFTTAQQDALLPGVEDGSVTLFGATTQNPSFEINAPLLSRCRLYRLDPLGDDDVRVLLDRAVTDPRGLPGVRLEQTAAEALVTAADGDARFALGALEAAATAATAHGDPVVDLAAVRAALVTPVLRYDKAGDAHYDQVSAFIKSMRASDADEALYWLVRMLTAGEDPRFLARRMVIFASEDVGSADPAALPLATAAFDALEFVGLPEARYALAQAALALAGAPKSRAVADALHAADELVRRRGNVEVPPHLRNR